MNKKQAMGLIGTGTDEAYNSLMNNSTAFADYFKSVNDVTNNAPLETYGRNGSNCYPAANKQMNNAGYNVPEGPAAINIINGTTTKGENLNPKGYTADAIGGAIRIMTELKKGRPVMVGVFQSTEKGIIYESTNANPITSHFIVIRSSKVNNDGSVVFNFLDNGCYTMGKSSNNNLILNMSTGEITGVRPCDSGTTFTVSGVRKSVKN